MYNLSGIRGIANGDEDFLKLLVKTFIAEVPADVTGLVDAVDNGNAALAYQYAHKLKPNFMSFGLDLEYDLNIVENWSQGKAEKEMADTSARKIHSAMKRVVDDLREDFNL